MKYSTIFQEVFSIFATEKFTFVARNYEKGLSD